MEPRQLRASRAPYATISSVELSATTPGTAVDELPLERPDAWSGSFRRATQVTVGIKRLNLCASPRLGPFSQLVFRGRGEAEWTGTRRARREIPGCAA